MGGGCPPSHSESFLHFDVVNGAIWCICPVYSSYSTNLYLILFWKWLKGGSFTCIHATLFSFFSLSLSPPFFPFFFWGGPPTPPPPPLATRLLPGIQFFSAHFSFPRVLAKEGTVTNCWHYVQLSLLYEPSAVIERKI